MPKLKNDPGDFRFCPYCAGPLTLREDGLLERLTCEPCNWVYYRNPVAAAGGVIMRDGRVCLVKRSIQPRLGDWTLPAGFVEYDETPQACAVREIEEETGLKVSIDGIHGVYEGFDDPRHHVVLVLYRLREIEPREAIAGDDAAEVGFFGAEEIPTNIAFRAHRMALRDLFGAEVRVS